MKGRKKGEGYAYESNGLFITNVKRLHGSKMSASMQAAMVTDKTLDQKIPSLAPATVKPWEKPNPWETQADKQERWRQKDILKLKEADYPKFALAKNKARFLRMVNWYRAKKEWLKVASISGVLKLFKQQTKELEGIRANKLDYEMEFELGTLTPSQKNYRQDELKMCEVHECMAVDLITRMQAKIKLGRR